MFLKHGWQRLTSIKRASTRKLFRLYKRLFEQKALILESQTPIFYHKPDGQVPNGMTKQVIRDFHKLCKQVIQNKSQIHYPTIANLTFMTYSNYQSKTLLERCYDAYRIKNYVVVGREVVQWDWMAKIQPVLTYLESTACRSEYIVVTDASDVLMVNNPSHIIEYFEGYDCDLLFCNTMADWPPNKRCRDFETLTYYTHPLHCRLSAGGYIGHKSALIRYLREIIEAYHEEASWTQYKGRFDDQLSWRHLHCQYYPRIKVDYKSLIFRRFDIFRFLDY